jgi:hypothetical protein
MNLAYSFTRKNRVLKRRRKAVFNKDVFSFLESCFDSSMLSSLQRVLFEVSSEKTEVGGANSRHERGL